jgi:hypothetical protein
MARKFSGRPPGVEPAAVRAAFLALLLMLAAAALRGYLPDRDRPGDGATGDSIALVGVVAMLSVTVAVMAVSLIARFRDRRAAAGSLSHLAERRFGRGDRLDRRAVLRALGLVAGAVAIMSAAVALLATHPGVPVSVAPPTPSTQMPDDQTASSATGGLWPQMQPGQQQPEVLGYLVIAAVCTLVMIAAAAASALRRRSTPAPAHADGRVPPTVGDPDPASLIRAARLGLAEMADPVRGPREAIIACYATMERELSHLPDAAPQDFDTPTEVLARAVTHHALHADNAAQLVALFTEARFSRHVMTEGHRDAAARVLRLVLAELSRPDAPRSTS